MNWFKSFIGPLVIGPLTLYALGWTTVYILAGQLEEKLVKDNLSLYIYTMVSLTLTTLVIGLTQKLFKLKSLPVAIGAGFGICGFLCFDHRLGFAISAGVVVSFLCRILLPDSAE